MRGRARRQVRPALRRELVRQMKRAMQAAGARGAMTLSLSDDDELLALNRQYADEDHATDVLSFEQAQPLLGDVVISVETARRQADERERPLLDELVHLSVHGLAHLLGYDHATKRQEQVMFGYEAKLRAQAIGRGAPKRVRRPKIQINSRLSRRG